MENINLSYQSGKGFSVGATCWGGDQSPEEDYKDGMSSSQIVALIKDPRTRLRTASLWVNGTQVTKHTTKSKILAILKKFPKRLEASASRSAYGFDVWAKNNRSEEGVEARKLGIYEP